AGGVGGAVVHRGRAQGEGAARGHVEDHTDRPVHQVAGRAAVAGGGAAGAGGLQRLVAGGAGDRRGRGVDHGDGEGAAAGVAGGVGGAVVHRGRAQGEGAARGHVEDHTDRPVHQVAGRAAVAGGGAA